MGLIAWITQSVKRNLDRRVTGSAGTAEFRFDRLADGAPLLARAYLSDRAGGAVRLHASPGEGPPIDKQGDGAVSCDLGPGKPLRGGTLTVEAQAVLPSPGALGALVVEVSQPAGEGRAPLASQSYSVEARGDAQGQAQLRLAVHLG